MPDVVVSDGLRMAYREQGQGPVLLLVHGWAAHGGFFQPQLDQLSDRFRVIAPDLRAHGRSQARAGEELTVERLAADLSAFMAQLSLRDVLAVGWSMGAMVLWQAHLAGSGERLTGLVIEDMSPRIVNDEDWSLGLKGGYDFEAVSAARQAMEQDWPAFAQGVARSIIGDDAAARHADLLAYIGREIAAQDPQPLARLWGSLAVQDFRGRLSAISTPSLIIHGRFGLYDAETSRFLERELPSATRVSFPDSGHAPHMEEPERFNRTIVDFHQRLTARREPAAANAL